MRINIDSIDPYWSVAQSSAFVANEPQQWRVHSRFKHAINLMDETGQLYTFLAKGYPNGPATLLLDIPNFEGLPVSLNAGEIVTYHAGYFHAGGITFVMSDNTRLWHSAVPVFPQMDDLFDNARTLLGATLEAHEQRKSALILSNTDNKVSEPDPILSHIAGKLAQGLTEITQAIATHDAQGISAAAQSLIGLGLGLTPSGDDQLVGLLLMLHCQRKRYQQAIALISEVIATSTEKTHEISWWMLHHASRGHFNEWMIAYPQALILSSDAESVGKAQAAQREALTNILSIGSQSGSDMVRGIASGLVLMSAFEADAVS